MSSGKEEELAVAAVTETLRRKRCIISPRNITATIIRFAQIQWVMAVLGYYKEKP